MYALNVRHDGSPGGCAHHCVGIRVVNPGADPDLDANCAFPGAAHLSIYGTNHLDEGTNIKLNQACVDGPGYHLNLAERRKTACQEIGHTIGLGHRYELSTCMHQKPTEATQLNPDGHDFNEANGIYQGHGV